MARRAYGDTSREMLLDAICGAPEQLPYGARRRAEETGFMVNGHWQRDKLTLLGLDTLTEMYLSIKRMEVPRVLP